MYILPFFKKRTLFRLQRKCYGRLIKWYWCLNALIGTDHVGKLGSRQCRGGQKIFHFPQLLYVVSVAICLRLGFAFCVVVLNLGFGFIVENLYMKCVFYENTGKAIFTRSSIFVIILVIYGSHTIILDLEIISGKIQGIGLWNILWKI